MKQPIKLKGGSNDGLTVYDDPRRGFLKIPERISLRESDPMNTIMSENTLCNLETYIVKELYINGYHKGWEAEYEAGK